MPGSTSKVKIVEEIMPPITTVASGRCTSEPVPVASAMGINPKEATSAVIKTGRNLANDPVNVASCKPICCCCRNFVINEIMTKPFNTATPDNAMKPTPAEMDNGIPRIHNAKTPPVNASGIPVKTNRASLKFLKVENNSRNTIIKVRGTTNSNRFVADSNCSKVPPKSIQ